MTLLKLWRAKSTDCARRPRVSKIPCQTGKAMRSLWRSIQNPTPALGTAKSLSLFFEVETFWNILTHRLRHFQPDVHLRHCHWSATGATHGAAGGAASFWQEKGHYMPYTHGSSGASVCQLLFRSWVSDVGRCCEMFVKRPDFARTLRFSQDCN
jgi:hypothetical protein